MAPRSASETLDRYYATVAGLANCAARRVLVEQAAATPVGGVRLDCRGAPEIPGTPAGIPSTSEINPRPCDSPAVR